MIIWAKISKKKIKERLILRHRNASLKLLLICVPSLKGQRGLPGEQGFKGLPGPVVR